MADNVAVTAGVGTSIATDDISSVHYQRVKFGVGTDGNYNEMQPCTIGVVSASTTDTNIVASSAILFGVSAWSTGSTASAVRVLIRDSTSGTTGNLLTAFWTSTAAAGGAGQTAADFRWFGPQGLNCASGIRVMIPTTEPASVSVYYQTQT